MTEGIIIGVTVALFTGMLGIILGSKKKVSEEDFGRHKSDPFPHQNCAVHKSKIDDIKSQLTHMDGKLDKLLER